MNSVDLQFFIAVATSGGIGRAALSLNTVQSNVTGRIRRLEEELGAALFYRDAKGVSLTSAGERLLPYALQSSKVLMDARRAIDAGDDPDGPLIVGSMESAAALRLPSLFSGFLKKYPKVDLHLETGPTQHLLKKVICRDIEGAFVAEPIQCEGLIMHAAFNEGLVFITHSDITNFSHFSEMLHKNPAIRILVFRPGCSYRRQLELYLSEEGVNSVRYMEMGTLDGIIGCVAAGMGISLIPNYVAQAVKDWRNIAVHPLPDCRGHVPTVYVHREDLLISAAHRRFLEELKSITHEPGALKYSAA